MERATEGIDAQLARIEALLSSDPEWSSDLSSGRDEFFGPDRGSRPDAAAGRRHLEWFLFERLDTRGPEVAIERVARRWPTEAGLGDEGALSALRDSIAGVFEVTGVVPGEGAWLRDLGGRGEFPVEDDAASRLIEPGDLIAGRLFPRAGSVHCMSSAAVFHRDPHLLEALRADFDRARETRRGVLRLSQLEIEQLLWRPVAPSSPGDPVETARALLLAGGVEPEQFDAWMGDLAQAPFDEARLVHGARDVLARILDRLAFETDVDLGEARKLLLLAWADLARRGPGDGPALEPAERAPAQDPGAEVSSAVRRFEEKRRAGEPLVSLLDELERDLVLSEVPEDEDESAGIPDFPGVVGAMVEEFLWETARRAGDAAAAEHANLRGLARSAASVGVFENLAARDLVAYAGWWLPENGDLDGPDDARQRIASLAAFCRWAEEEHQLEIPGAIPLLRELAVSLPRLAEANRWRTREAPKDQGELFAVAGVGERGLSVVDRRGRTREAQVDPALLKVLRPEDRVRASLHEDGQLAVYCCYPPDVARLGDV